MFINYGGFFVYKMEEKNIQNPSNIGNLVKTTFLSSTIAAAVVNLLVGFGTTYDRLSAGQPPSQISAYWDQQNSILKYFLSPGRIAAYKVDEIIPSLRGSRPERMFFYNNKKDN